MSTVMLVSLLGQSLLSSAVSSLEAVPTETQTTSSAGQEAENQTTSSTGQVLEDVTTSSTGQATEDLTISSTGQVSEDVTTASTGQVSDEQTGSTTASSTTPEVSASSSTASASEPQSAPSSAAEESVAVTPETPLVEGEETTKEELAALNIQPVFMAALLREATLPSEKDGSKIETIKLEWLTADTTDDGNANNLVQKWEDNQLKFVRLRISYSLSGDYDYEPGDIQLKIPRATFETRDGKVAGNVTWAVPQAPDRSGTFEYYLEKGDEADPLDDYYVMTNTRKLSAASQGYIEGTIKDFRPSDIFDKATGYQAETQATIQVTTQTGDLIAMDSNVLTAQIDTFSRLDAAYKYSSGWSQTYNGPAELKPDKPEDYIYTTWYMYTEVAEKANQPATIQIKDVASSYEAGKEAIVLGYRLGSQYVAGTGTDTVEGQIFDGFSAGPNQRHSVTVYVAYPKSEFPELDQQKVYNVSNTVTFTLTAKDDKEVSTKTASASQRIQVTQARPSSIGRTHFRKSWAPENLLGFAQLRNNETADLTYPIDGYYYSYANTKKDELGNVNPYQIIVTDDKVSIVEGTELTAQDFEFASLTFTLPTTRNYLPVASDTNGTYEASDGRLLSGEIKAGSYSYQPNTDLSKLPTYTVYGKTETGDFVEMGTVNFSSGQPVITTKNGATSQGSKLNFPANIVDYRVVIDSQVAYVSYNFSATVRIKPTDAIKARMENLMATASNPVITVVNQAYQEIKVDDKQISKLTDSDRGNLVGFINKVALDKEITYKNDVQNQSVRLTYTSTANFRTNARDQQVLQKYIDAGYYNEEKSTVWYDLLPPGVVPDLSTIKGRAGDVVTDVDIIENYQNTGRTLLKVTMTLSPQYRYVSQEETYRLAGMADFPQLTFQANYSWIASRMYGTDLTNIIAYESQNDQIGNIKDFKGEPDNPLACQNSESKTAVGDLAVAMTNLNSNRDTNSFIYASVREDLVIDTYTSTSLIKEVAVNGNGLFSDGRSEEDPKNVYEGGIYQYRIGVTNPLGTSTKDMIFYDFLEKYKPYGTDTDLDDVQWRGIFQNIDLREFIARGVAPVVYYSTKTGLNMTEANRADGDLSNTAIWSTTMPADKSTITAIAIDARRNQDGTAFELPENQTISAYVNMRAPFVDSIRGLADKEDYYDSVLNIGLPEANFMGGAHAYNNVIMVSRTVGTNGAESDSLFVEYNYTKVGIVPYRIVVKKAWEDGNNRDGLRPDSATIRLYANGKDSGRFVTLNDQNNWIQAFDDLDYIDSNGKRITYSLKEDTVTGYSFAISNTTQTNRGIIYDVTNTHTPERITISGVKNWVNDENDPEARPSSIRVSLHANGKLLQTQTVGPDANGDWKYSFTNLYKYENGQPVTYTVSEPDYIEGYRSIVKGTDITNEYDPYGDLKISKTVQGLTDVNKDNRFDFTIQITNKQGQPDYTIYDYETSDGRTGKVATGDTLSLKHDESVTIKRIHSGIPRSRSLMV